METAETPISKILINSSTKMSLNERFTTVMQAGPKITARKLGRRPLAQRASQSGAIIRKFSANRKFLDELAKKHKIMAALKIKKRNLKATMPARGRNRNRAAMKKVLRVGPNGQLTRANSLSKIATLKSDYVRPAVRRSNSTSNIAARLGSRRPSAGNAEPRRRLNRNNVIRRSNSKTNLTRSNSTASLRRSTSRQSLRRSNSRVNINRSNSRNRNSAPPINNRIARRNSISGRRGGRGGGGGGGVRGGGGGVAQGRIYKRRNSTGSANAVNNSVRQGRVSRTRGRGISTLRRGRSVSANRGNNVIVQQGRGRGRGRGAGGSGIVGRGGRGRGRGRGVSVGDIRRGGGNRARGGIGGRGRGRSRGRGTTRGTGRKTEIKKEDLDKELDQYMANTKGPADTDVLMNNSSI